MNSPRFRHAFDYAATLHAADIRKSTSIPYLSHLLEVCAIVMQHGGNEDAAIAALLHDAVEDHGGTRRLNDIRRNFGKAVALIVRECSDSTKTPRQSWEVRKRAYLKHLPKASKGGLLVSAADKLANARALLADYYEVGDKVFERYKHTKSRTLWYYNELSRIFTARFRGELAREFRRTVAELTRVSRRKADR
jgi:(p)ppGpp synthase/HD superfamily hydrolase